VTLPQPKAIRRELTRINTNKSWGVVAPGIVVYREDFWGQEYSVTWAQPKPLKHRGTEATEVFGVVRRLRNPPRAAKILMDSNAEIATYWRHPGDGGKKRAGSGFDPARFFLYSFI
jgi:hypothetical protein